MSGEEQERFEDYLELEKYVEELQAGRVAHPPEDLTPEQARVYRMATLFRSVSPEVSEPRPEFAAELQARLEQELEQKPQTRRSALLQRKKSQRKPVGVSRRSLLGGVAAVAASFVVGAGVDRVIEQNHKGGAPTGGQQVTNVDTPLVPASVPAVWHTVIALTDLWDDAVYFKTNTISGYVLRVPSSASQQQSATPDTGPTATAWPGQNDDTGPVIAMSAACTHMGCIVQWQKDRKFHCPCHGGVFSATGEGLVLPGKITYLLPLPRLDVKIEDGLVKVRVPAPLI